MSSSVVVVGPLSRLADGGVQRVSKNKSFLVWAWIARSVLLFVVSRGRLPSGQCVDSGETRRRRGRICARRECSCGRQCEQGRGSDSWLGRMGVHGGTAQESGRGRLNQSQEEGPSRQLLHRLGVLGISMMVEIFSVVMGMPTSCRMRAAGVRIRDSAGTQAEASV